jgi:DNA-directed RNA polymerase specialized sigma24 family protein
MDRRKDTCAMNPIHLTTTTLSTLTDSSLASPTTNDNAIPKRLSTNPNALLAHSEVTRAIEGTLLQHGLARQELRDGVAQVQMRALGALQNKPRPADLGGWKALCCTIAERLVLKDRKREAKRGLYHDGLSDEADEHSPIARSPGKVEDPVDLARQRKALEGQFEAGDMPEHGEVILDAIAAGESYKDIGAELGLTEAQVRRRLARMRKLFKAKLASLGMLALMALLAVMFATPFGGVATRDPGPQPTLQATTVQPVTPEQRATALRAEALRACHAEKWDLCVGRLDEARTLDPAGDHGADVNAARARAVDALDAQEREMEAKPRP